MQRVLCLGLTGLVGVLSAFGCSSDKEATQATCPVQVHTTCPDASLSYAIGIGEALKAACSPCHAPGGIESSVPLMSYSQSKMRTTSIVGQLVTCSMPPAGSPLSLADRQAIVDWITCGAPP